MTYHCFIKVIVSSVLFHKALSTIVSAGRNWGEGSGCFYKCYFRTKIQAIFFFFFNQVLCDSCSLNMTIMLRKALFSPLSGGLWSTKKYDKMYFINLSVEKKFSLAKLSSYL